MQAKYLVVDKGGQGQVIEKIGKGLPNICIPVFSKTLIIESIDLSDLTRFVIASKNCNAPWVSYFQSNKECHGLNRVVASINIVPFDSTSQRRLERSCSTHP